VTAYRAKWYEFTGHPASDSCWSLSVGPDGRIYAASCAETAPGETVKVVRYNEKTDALDYLFDLDQVVDDPRDSGRATQCKIHYSFAPASGEVRDVGVAVSVIERRRYGYVFGDAVTGRDGEIILGEDDDLGHLWLYFPKIEPRKGTPDHPSARRSA